MQSKLATEHGNRIHPFERQHAPFHHGRHKQSPQRTAPVLSND